MKLKQYFALLTLSLFVPIANSAEFVKGEKLQLLSNLHPGRE